MALSLSPVRRALDPIMQLLRRLVRPVVEPIRRRLPTRITPMTRLLALATLIANVGIMVTGGAVRLTASGLGCPEWPRCTPESWTATPEMGVNGAIEFGNRLLTYVLIAITVAMFLAVARLARSHRPLWARSLIIGLGIPFQGVIGGITVWTNLNPWVVSLHFLLSSALVLLSTQLLLRVRAELDAETAATGTPAPRLLAAGVRDPLSRGMAMIVLVTAWAAVIAGTVVTGTGPHAGDPGSPRHDFDPELITRVHTMPVYLLCAAAVVLLVRQRLLDDSPARRRASWWLVVAIVLQAALGYTQHFLGLPIGLVLLHMLGSALLMIAATVVFDRHRARYCTRGTTAGAAATTTA